MPPVLYFVLMAAIQHNKGGILNKMKNILLITADHMRYDALGCNNNKLVKTTNLDRLAAEGINFNNAFTPAPLCIPARASITTGNYPHKSIGVKTNASQFVKVSSIDDLKNINLPGQIRKTQPRIAPHFKKAGYKTYALGKLHYVPYYPPGQPRNIHGFDHAELAEEGRILKIFDPEGRKSGLEDYHDYLHQVGWGGFERGHGVGNNDIHPAPSPLPPEHYVDHWVADRSMEVIKKHMEENNDKPFFMWTSFVKPHSPYDPPRPYDKMYDPRDVPAPYGGPELLSSKSPILKQMRKAMGWDMLPPEMTQVIRAYYYGMVTFQDEMIGRLLSFLSKNNLDKDTVILYTSDHGDLLGDFGCFLKANHLNGSVKVPFIIKALGLIPAGKVSNELVGLQDILPTLSALAGVPFNYKVDGLNIVPIINGDCSGRKAYVAHIGSSYHKDNKNSNDSKFEVFDGGGYGSNCGQTSMVCNRRWKYIYSEANGFEELYDLKSDPNELYNLAEDKIKKSKVEEFRNYLVSWCKRHGDYELLENNALKSTVINQENVSFDFKTMGWRWY